MHTIICVYHILHELAISAEHVDALTPQQRGSCTAFRDVYHVVLSQLRRHLFLPETVFFTAPTDTRNWSRDDKVFMSSGGK